MNLTNHVLHKKVYGNIAAGTDVSAVTGDAIDLISTGTFNRARVIFELGAVTSGGVLKAAILQADAAAGEYEEIASLGEDGFTATNKSDTSVIFDVPATKGFLKIRYQRGTANIEIDAITIDLYSGRMTPATQDASVSKAIVE